MDLLVPHVRTAGGFALDDFPASAAQAEALDDELGERSAGPLHHVISLEGPTDDELVERVLSGRVHGRATDFVYHLTNDPPPKAAERLDPGPFVRREDDTEGVLRRRLGAYRRDHAQLKERYQERGVLRKDRRRPALARRGGPGRARRAREPGGPAVLRLVRPAGLTPPPGGRVAIKIPEILEVSSCR